MVLLSSILNSAAKTIVVFGTTGLQGRSVAQALVKDDAFHVKAYTRDPKRTQLQDLKDQGMEVVKADLDQPESLRRALDGAYGMYVVLNFFQHNSRRKEIAQGKAIVDAAKDAGIEHLIFSGSESVQDTVGKECAWFDNKAIIESYLQAQAVPFTCLRMAYYCENLLTIAKPMKTELGQDLVILPMNNKPMDMLVVSEVGECVRSILKAGDEYKNQKIGLSSDRLTIRQYCNVLNQITGKKYVPTEMTVEKYAKMGFPTSQGAAAMFDFYQRGNPVRDIALTKKLHPGMPDFRQWVENNKPSFMN